MPVEIPGYVFGLTKISFLKYAIATFLAEVPFTIIVVFGSEAFIEKNPVIFILFLILWAVFLLGAFFIFLKIAKKKRKKAQ